jgi:hypothetical protein
MSGSLAGATTGVTSAHEQAIQRRQRDEMIRSATDEDFNNRILRGLLRRQPDLDMIRSQNDHLSGADDTDVLEWASHERRALLTHDVSTMSVHAFERIRSGQSIAGLIEVPQSMPIGQAIEDILTIRASLFTSHATPIHGVFKSAMPST